MFRNVKTVLSILPVVLLSLTSAAYSQVPLSPEVAEILEKPLYKNATWGILVIDLATGDLVHAQNADKKLFIGSIRKMFSVGLAMDKLGTDYRFVTPVYRQGDVKEGVLKGDLVLVASGDLSMGGREQADGKIAYTDFDHNEANSLGNAILTKTDPLAGYRSLAKQIADAGIKKIDGDVIIDDRLFKSFNFRNEFDLRPIFVNDDLVDITMQPSAAGEKATADWRPHSAALTLSPSIEMSPAGSQFELDYEELPNCIGQAGCDVPVKGQLPLKYLPPLTGKYPLVRCVRITQPQNYARTVLIEELTKAGVEVTADKTAANASDKLPAAGSYQADQQVAKLTSAPYEQFAEWILKVSYNIGADTSLMLYGVENGVDTLDQSLAVEAKALKSQFNIPADQYQFFDGSGGGDSAATPQAVTTLLSKRAKIENFPDFKKALPRLGVDGSLATVNHFERVGALAAAKGNVYAKTGTYITADEKGNWNVRCQGISGYIDATSGRKFAFVLLVNDVSPISGVEDILQIMQDQGEIAAWWWRQH